MNAFFEFYHEHEAVFYSTQLVLAMLGMGATSTLQQFRDVLRAPGNIALVLALQFLVMPLLAVAFGRLTGMPSEIVIGLILLMALPSGSLSNILTFLGRGSVPLSIAATCASTALCLLATPLVLKVFAGAICLQALKYRSTRRSSRSRYCSCCHWPLAWRLVAAGRVHAGRSRSWP